MTLPLPRAEGQRRAAQPFPLQIPADQAFAHTAWSGARASCLDALRQGEDVLLLGAAGFGKTLLLHDIAASLRGEGRMVRLFDPAAAAQATGGVLLVDEAAAVPEAMLATLLAAHRPVLLAALPGAAERLGTLPRPLRPVTLAPLTVEEVARFVATRLAAAGLPRDRVAPDAVLALARWSGGAMRLVVGLANAALFLAEQDTAGQVRAQHVEEAAALRGLAAPAPTSPDANPEPPGAEAAHDPAPLEAAPGSAPATPAEPAPAPHPRAEAAPEPEPVAAPRPMSAEAGPLAGPAARAPRRRRRLVPGTGTMAAATLVVALAWAAVRPAPEAPTTGAPASLAPSEAAAPPRAVVPEMPAPPSPREAPQAAARVPLPWILEAPPPPAAPDRGVTFRGPILNETLNRSGQLAVTVLRQPEAGTVTVRFQASAGLLGTGELHGTISPSGEISASGRLMMGRNPHDCVLTARVSGDRLTGSASFRRPGRGGETRSSFILGRS